MKVKERRILQAFLQGNDIEGALGYLANCKTEGHETRHERNRRWAENNPIVKRYVETLEEGQSVQVNTNDMPRGTMSCAVHYAYPDRKFRIVKIDDENYFVIRVM